MRVYCRGFNLFRQLKVSQPIIKEFSNVFQFEDIKEVNLNTSYSIILTRQQCCIFNGEKVQDLVSVANTDISLISSNDDHVIFVTNGKVVTKNLDNFEVTTSTKYEELFPNCAIKKIECGSKLTIIYTEDGTLCKVCDKIPHILKFNSQNVSDVKCGREHCLLLDDDGNVYSFGNGSRGQLGHGRLDDEPEPILIEALAGIKMKKIAAGGWHSCAISEDGDLYAWGWNTNGQLGLGKEDGDDGFVAVMATPHVVDFCEQDLNASYLSCGSRHTIVFLDNKQLYGCGWNKYNQLTKENQENYYKLTHLHNFENDTVLGLYCGPWNSAVQCQ